MTSVNYMTPKQAGSGLTDQLKSWNKANDFSGSAASMKSVQAAQGAQAPMGDFMNSLSGAFKQFGQNQSSYQPFQATPYSVEGMQDFSQQYNNQMVNAMKAYYRSIPTSMNYPKVGGR